MRILLKLWWVWAGAALILLALVMGYVMIPIEQPRISQANCDRIQIGWTVEQVEELLNMRLVEDESWQVMVTYRSDGEGNGIDLTISKAHGVMFKKFTPSALSFQEKLKRRIERRIRAI